MPRLRAALCHSFTFATVLRLQWTHCSNCMYVWKDIWNFWNQLFLVNVIPFVLMTLLAPEENVEGVTKAAQSHLRSTWFIRLQVREGRGRSSPTWLKVRSIGSRSNGFAQLWHYLLCAAVCSIMYLWSLILCCLILFSDILYCGKELNEIIQFENLCGLSTLALHQQLNVKIPFSETDIVRLHFCEHGTGTSTAN